jgi:hypothetical protein
MWNTGKTERFIPPVLAVLAVLILPVLPGCTPLLSFEYLDISCSAAEGENYYSGETVLLEFSIKPDRGETERTLILSEGGLSKTPVFSWEDRVLSVEPLGGWKKGEHYRIGLEGRIHTEDGRGYTTRLLRSFIYGREGDEFTLESSEMEDGCLVLNFSKAPGISSFPEHFSLSPDTEYFCDFLGKTVKIQPKSPWQINTRYTWTIGGMESADGYTMKRDYSSAFSGPDDFEIPRLTELCPVNRQFSSGPPYLWKWGTALDGNLENYEGIGFTFSKAMDHASLRLGISLYPAIKGYFEEAGEDSIIFFPEEEYQPETEYRITLSPVLKDSLGLGLFEELRCYFSSAQHYLDVEKLNLDSDSHPLEPGGIPQEHFLLSATDLELRIAFSQVIPPDRRRAAAEAVSLSVLFPASAHNPNLVSVRWQDGGALLSMSFTDLSPSAGGIDNYYQIKISSGKLGPVSGSGEYLKEDLWYVIQVR